MTLRNCTPAGTLVGPELWLPLEPFDYAWGRLGCNHLRCGACNQAVGSRIDDANRVRNYECACQSRDQHGFYWIGEDAGQDRAFETAWYCGGHPVLELPVVLDGVELSAIGPYTLIVGEGLAEPPFMAPGFSSSSFWVQRLYRLLASQTQKTLVSQAVASYLSSDVAKVAVAAMEFFRDIPGASGAERTALIASRDGERLRATPDPGEPSRSLYARILETIEARLVVGDDLVPDDQLALEIAREALIRGEASPGMIPRLARLDARWFCESAAKVVQANPSELTLVLHVLTAAPERLQEQAIASIRGLDKKTNAAVRQWMREKGLRIRTPSSDA